MSPLLAMLVNPRPVISNCSFTITLSRVSCDQFWFQPTNIHFVVPISFFGGLLEEMRCCRLCQSDPSFGSVSFTPVPLLSLCALQGGGIGGGEEGRGHFHPGSCLPVVPPLLCRQMGHFFTPPNPSCPSLNFRKAHNLGLLPTGIESRIGR